MVKARRLPNSFTKSVFFSTKATFQLNALQKVRAVPCGFDKVYKPFTIPTWRFTSYLPKERRLMIKSITSKSSEVV